MGLGTCFAQPAYTWANSIGNTGADVGQSIAIDGSGNVYITGSFTGIADFDPGAGTANLTSTGATDIFVAKYTSAGAYLWAFNIGSATGSGVGNAITLDGSSNVYVTGFFMGTADFNPSGATNNLTSGGSVDIFVAKYTSGGAYLWAFKVGEAGADGGEGISLDGSGNVYVTGYFQGTTDFDPGGGVVNLISTGSTDIFVAKYTSAGAYQWAFKIGGAVGDFGYGIDVDGSGNCYVTGFFNGPNTDFNPGAGTAFLSTGGPGDDDVFVAKYNSSGVYQWAFNIGTGTSSASIGYGIAVDGSGNCYITGVVGGPNVDFDPGGGVAILQAGGFVAKYNSSGIYQWAFNTGGGYSIKVDGSGNNYITGRFQGTVDFDPSASTANLTSSLFNTDIFIAKYTSSGTYLCAGKMGGTGNETGYGITVDGSGNTFVTGSFASAPADFDPGAGTANLTTAGGNDIFFAKYSQCSGFTATQFCVAVGGAGSDGGQSIVQTSDGGYAVAGSTGSFGQGSSDVYVVKVDASGTVQWTRTVGQAVTEVSYSIVQTSDGGYVVGGTYNDGWFLNDANAYIIKLDGNGTVQWTQIINGSGWDNCKSINQVSDGGFVMTGAYNGGGASAVYVIKLDGSGALQWTRTVSTNPTPEDAWGNSIIQTTDGGYAVAGGTSGSGNGYIDMYVIKLDGSGTVLWTRKVGGVSSNTCGSEGRSIVQTSDGGLAVAGGTACFGQGNSDVYVVKLDGSGTLQWTRTVGGAGIDAGYSIVQISDGGLAVAGWTYSYGAGGSDVYVVKLDGSGTVLWTRTFGGTGTDEGKSIVQTSDGGFAVTGSTNSFGSGGNDVYIIKIAP